MKTNAARLLDTLGIAYETREYEIDESDLSAETVAKKVGFPPEQVFKTLLAVIDGKHHVFAVVPGDSELDFKKLAAAAGGKKADLAPLKEVQPLTGYIRGGVTVFGAKKEYPVFADETIELFDVISVSAGRRGLQLILSPSDYVHAAKATVVALTR
ncbi:MAG: Cys-tRNA(Pro) deacylase [Candidatus Sumerlaeia bacterium]